MFGFYGGEVRSRKEDYVISKESEYELMRESNSKERMEAFKDMFKRIGELS